MNNSSKYLPVDRGDVPIRLFQSDFLEFFTHISPIVVLIIWGPLALFFLFTAIRNSLAGGSWLTVLLGFPLGLFLWTITEYLGHRFLFHHKPSSPRQERIFFLFHGVHHAQPQCKTRLVMPPAVSVPLAIIFYGLFYLAWKVIIGEPQWIAPCFAGFLTGYLAYDMIHYATHHFPMRWGFLKFLKRYHMQHHYKTPDARYGVSSPLWDKVFGTYLA
jgi:sterol desaturase/sphingolipid hydroxylase (fatty acid hydroxylase superfamily)